MKDRLSQIDGLRGIAAFSVLLYHLSTRYHEFFGGTPLFRLPLGQYGVQLFFAISGFVILMTLTKIRSPMDFIVSRFSRLYPTYWTALLVTSTTLAFLPIPIEHLSLGMVLENLLMFHGFAGVAHVDGVYWTLECELVFYVLMLLGWKAGLLKRPLAITAAWVLLAFVPLFFYVPWTIVRLTLLQYIPWFALGMTAYVLHAMGPDWKRSPIPAALALGCVWVASGPWAALFGLAVFCVVFGAAQGSLPFLAKGPLVFLGAISYPLYLVHQNVSYALMLRMDAAHWPHLLVFLTAVVVSLTLAWVIHCAVEIPAMKAIRGWYKARPASAASLSASR